MTTPKNVMKMIKDSDVKYADFRFTDPRGKWQHVTFDISQIEEETFAEGMMFDGSSIAGWKAINESDMCLMPDPTSVCIDPFFAETTIVLQQRTDVLTVPAGAVVRQDGNSFAMVVDHDNKVVKAAVKVGVEGADRVEITSGVTEGQSVIVSGQTNYQAGQVVHPKLFTVSMPDQGDNQ